VLPLILHKEHRMSLEMTLSNMSCGHCVKSVTQVAQRVDAGARVLVDLPTQRVTIEGASAPREAFEAAFAEEGYPPAAASR
jgi:copper chaperone